MKEGYLQLKIAELDAKCKKIDEMISLEKSKIQLLEERVGGSKELIKKLKDLESFKQETVKQIKKENQEVLTSQIDKISKKIADNIESSIIKKQKEMDNNLDFMKNIEEIVNKQNKIISDLDKKIDYLMKHNELFMMKLVNKSIISDREVNEMHKRSEKK